MESGYLLIQTREDHHGLVCLADSEGPPPLPPAADPSGLLQIRYAARFDDIDAALMHAHTALRHSLVDVERRLYRTEVLQAVAAVDTIALRHRRIYLDPALENDQRLAAEIARRDKSHRRNDLIWQGIGLTAAALLVTILLFGV